MLYENIVSRQPVEKGWSGDRKYCVQTADGSRYLLRISPMERLEQRKMLFDLQKQAEKTGIRMCLTVEMGVCDEGVYLLQTWVDGTDAEEHVPELHEEDQYRLGLDAGRMLKKLHTIPAPDDQADWEVRFNAKMDRKIALYRACPIQYDGAECFVRYIEANRHLLKNRPQTFQHGDYHIGNMMLEKGQIVVIDFDRFDFGDPWEEFNRIVWCAQKAPVFACGMVDGYFDGPPPQAFWDLLALYIASNTLASVPWAVPFGEKEIQVMLTQAKEVLSWYDNMQKTMPNWYKSAEIGKKMNKF